MKKSILNFLLPLGLLFGGSQCKQDANGHNSQGLEQNTARSELDVRQVWTDAKNDVFGAGSVLILEETDYGSLEVSPNADTIFLDPEFAVAASHSAEAYMLHEKGHSVRPAVFDSLASQLNPSLSPQQIEEIACDLFMTNELMNKYGKGAGMKKATQGFKDCMQHDSELLLQMTKEGDFVVGDTKILLVENDKVSINTAAITSFFDISEKKFAKNEHTLALSITLQEYRIKNEDSVTVPLSDFLTKATDTFYNMGSRSDEHPSDRIRVDCITKAATQGNLPIAVSNFQKR